MKTKIRIAIDALGVNEVGGARSVTLPLLSKVFQKKHDWEFFCYLSAYEKELDFPNVKQIIIPLSKGLISRLIFQLIVPILTLVYKIKITHFIKSQASLIFFSRKVLTIYDCTILRYPEYFRWTSRYFWRYLQPLICGNMDQIITISDDAKSEIINYLKVKPEKVEVIYPASQFNFHDNQVPISFSNVKEKYELGENYLLYIGQIGLKKNLMTLVNAYHAIKQNRPSFPSLYLVGPRYYLSDAGKIIDEIIELGLDDNVHYLGPIPENELYVILENSTMLLFPSVHEGFGIPMLEAMELGIPVIASNTSVMPEVICDAGVLVDDFLSPNQWAKTIVSLFDSNEDRKILSQKGKNRAKEFSWDYSAKQLIKTYEKLL